MRTLKAMILTLVILPFLAFSLTENEIEDVIHQCVDGGHTYGIIVGVIDENGTNFYKYGQRGKNDLAPVDENTVFETGSITKIFTSLLLSHMVKEKEVRLTDPIEMFLPDDVRIPQYKNNKITLEHLATHFGSLPYMPKNFIITDMYNPFVDYKVEYLYDFFNNYELPYPPGSKYIYSNISIGMLGHCLALKANANYEDLVIERLLKPLDMNDTKCTLSESMLERYAAAHIRDKEVSHWEIPLLQAAGGVHSTPADLAKFIEANLGLRNTEINDLLKASIEKRYPQDEPYLDVANEWNISYKYSPEIFYHGGSTGGHQVFLGFCPKTKTGVVVCSNSAAWIYDIGKAILHPKWYLKKYRQQIIAIPIMLPRFMGEYENVDGGSKCYVSMESNGHKSMLLLKWSYYPKIPMFQYTDEDFFLKVKPVDMHFDIDEDDLQVVHGLRIDYDGTIYNFRKVK